MGGCFSGDVRGGMEAVGGGGSGGARCRGPAAAGPNEAVDHFFQGQALRLYTPLEVRSLPSPPRETLASVQSSAARLVAETFPEWHGLRIRGRDWSGGFG